MATKRTQGGAQGSGGGGGGGGGNTTTNTATASKANPTATHVHASSLAVPFQSNLSQLEAQLTSLSQRISPLLQRDVVLSRIDDSHPYRVELEGGDSSFAPLRRARIQSRLHVRFQSQKVELRVYSLGQGGGGATKGSDLVSIKSLVCTQLDSGQSEEETGFSDEDEEVMTRDEVASKRTRKEGEMMPIEIDAGGNYWRQITLAMGWIPHHTVIRSGHCFTIRQDKAMEVNVYLFHLLKLNEDSKPVTLERVSDTRILQAVVTINLSSKSDGSSGESGSMANLSDRAHAEVVKLQESLRGLVDLNKDVD